MDRRTQLLDVALNLFDERGVRGASMRELASRAGVDVRTAYYHFESKRDLLRALFEQAGAAPMSRPVPAETLEVLRAANPEDALLGIISGNLELLQTDAARARLIHVEVLYGDEDAKAVGDELWARWGELLEELVDAAGVVPRDEIPAFARLLRSLLWGVFNESQLTGEIADPVKRFERAKELTTFLLPSKRTRAPRSIKR